MTCFRYHTSATMSDLEFASLTKHLINHDEEYFPSLSSRGFGIADFLTNWADRHGTVIALWDDDKILASIGTWREDPITVYVEWLNVPLHLRLTKTLPKLLSLCYQRETCVAETRWATARTWAGNNRTPRLLKHLGFSESHRIQGEFCPSRTSIYYRVEWEALGLHIKKIEQAISPAKLVDCNTWIFKLQPTAAI
jgi:hypothetical protein